jgi:putative addiction module component (TIGR02574 family)
LIALSATRDHFSFMTIALEQIRQMPVVQRIQLVEDIWDTMVAEEVDFPMSSAQLTELDARRAAMLADPSIGIPWAEAKTRLLAEI